jgi:hypothetical protein
MPSQALADAFLVLWVWPSHLALPVLLATVVLARDVDRHPAFVNMVMTEIIAGVFTSVLYVLSSVFAAGAYGPCYRLYAGKAHVDGPLPSLSLCSFQASVLSGTITLYAHPLLTSSGR